MGRMMSSSEFNQNPSEAKRAADEGPVIVTDRGEPVYVLLKYDIYRRLSGEGPGSIIEMLRQDEGDYDFDLPRLEDDFARPANLD
jgi:prevent-host-death family protein